MTGEIKPQRMHRNCPNSTCPKDLIGDYIYFYLNFQKQTIPVESYVKNTFIEYLFYVFLIAHYCYT